MVNVYNSSPQNKYKKKNGYGYKCTEILTVALSSRLKILLKSFLVVQMHSLISVIMVTLQNQNTR